MGETSEGTEVHRSRRFEVWVDEDLCTGCGWCAETAPDVFEMINGVSHVKQGGIALQSSEVALVPLGQETLVVKAAENCPGELIFIREATVPARDS